MKIEHSMTKEVVYCRTFERVEMAYAVMREIGTRHMPVLDGNKLVGIISDRDILLAAESTEMGNLKFGNLKCGDIMTEDVIVTSPETSISLSVDLMIKYKIDSLPVVTDHRELVGIVTTTDLLMLLKILGEEIIDDPLPFSYELKDAPSFRLVS